MSATGRQAAGDLHIRAGCECGGFFLPDLERRNAPVSVQRIGEANDAAARDPKDVLVACCGGPATVLQNRPHRQLLRDSHHESIDTTLDE